MAFSSAAAASGSLAGSSAAGSSAASSPVMALLIAFRAAVEVTVAPDRASTPFSPKVKGPSLPMNWSVNSASDARLPRPSVSFGVSMVSSLTVLPSRTRCAVTSPPKPCMAASASDSPAASFLADGSYFRDSVPLNTPVIARTIAATSTAQIAIRIHCFLAK